MKIAFICKGKDLVKTLKEYQPNEQKERTSRPSKSN